MRNCVFGSGRLGVRKTREKRTLTVSRFDKQTVSSRTVPLVLTLFSHSARCLSFGDHPGSLVCTGAVVADPACFLQANSPRCATY